MERVVVEGALPRRASRASTRLAAVWPAPNGGLHRVPGGVDGYCATPAVGSHATATMGLQALLCIAVLAGLAALLEVRARHLSHPSPTASDAARRPGAPEGLTSSPRLLSAKREGCVRTTSILAATSPSLGSVAATGGMCPSSLPEQPPSRRARAVGVAANERRGEGGRRRGWDARGNSGGQGKAASPLTAMETLLDEHHHSTPLPLASPQ